MLLLRYLPVEVLCIVHWTDGQTDRLNTIRAILNKLRVIFIDEISMVESGSSTF